MAARRYETAEWILRGYSPSKIAKQMGVTFETVMQYLYHEVGKGTIRRSDMVFTIDAAIRQLIESLINELKTTYWFEIYRETEKRGTHIDRGDLRAYLELRDARIALGDMYEFIREIEMNLHDLVRSTLVSKYGPEEWWRRGVPSDIRANCSAELERDLEPASEPYCYTSFIHLSTIMEKQWSIFKQVLPKKLSSNRKILESRLGKLNQIRNCVMHPIKGVTPTEKDFAFVREFRGDLPLADR